MLLVLAAAASTQFGSAFAVLVLRQTGSLGVVTLRLVISAAILCALVRPRLRGRTRADMVWVVIFGVSLAGMNTSFYAAIERIPLGAAVTIEVVGPLVLSVVVARRVSAWVWAVLAFAGVATLSWGDVEGLDPLGVVFATGAAVMWAAYILSSAQVGRRWPRGDGLALAMVVAAVLVMPAGVVTAGTALTAPGVLGLGAVVAIMSSALPYSLELQALRRMPAGTFAVLMSLAPAIAALSGLLVLGQQLTIVQLGGMVMVIAASMGAVLAGDRKPPVVPASR